VSSILGIKVSGCYIYPLKSGRGISVDKLELTQRGPKNDRLWMLVQNQGPNAGKFITQRDKGCEKLALVKAFPNGLGDTKFSTPDGRTLVVSVDDLSCYDSVVHIWGDECVAMDAGNAIAHWFSDYLDQPCRLVKIPDDFIIAGYDNLSFCETFTPELTSIVTDFHELGKKSIRIIENMVADNSDSYGNISMIPVGIKIRNSTNSKN